VYRHGGQNHVGRLAISDLAAERLNLEGSGGASSVNKPKLDP
jgi:hypothetical protein